MVLRFQYQSVGFNSGINAFGTSGTSLPYINSSNTNFGVNTLGFNAPNSSFPFMAHTTCGINILSSNFYASHSGALGNSVINNPVSNTANVFGPIAGANTSFQYANLFINKYACPKSN